MNTIVKQLLAWPPTHTTVMGLGILIAVADYLVQGNFTLATGLGGVFSVVCPSSSGDVADVTALLPKIQDALSKSNPPPT